MNKSKPNYELSKFLEYYAKLKAPHYAVMLNGPWGAGKTWFIKDVIKNFPDSLGRLYVSLNGISSIAEIEERFFEQLHPILSNKKIKFMGSLVKGLAKGTLKIDLDSDGKDDGSANFSIPDINIASLMNKYESGFVLIFDDVERCQLPIAQILGYINLYVEHYDAPVILIANEDEISSKEDKYIYIREKLIGKTFTVEAEVDNALTSFINSINDEETRKIINNERDLIIATHISSDSKNLRHLRHAIFDISRIIEVIPRDKLNSEMLRDILRVFLIYQFELRSGNIKTEEFKQIDSWEFIATEEGSLISKLEKKYRQTGTLDSVFTNAIWIDFFANGFVDIKSITKAINESRYYTEKKSRADWLQLNDAFSMDDEPLADIIDKSIESLERNLYKSTGEIIHITGSLIALEKIGIVKQDIKKIVTASLGNISFLKDENAILSEPDYEKIFTEHNFLGHTFHSSQDPIFHEFIEKAAENVNKSKIAQYPVHAEELLNLLKQKNVDEFTRHIIFKIGNEGKFSKIPVLSHIKPDDFVAQIIQLNAKDLQLLTRAIEIRYKNTKSSIHSEQHWLKSIAERIAPDSYKFSTMSAFFRNELYKTIKSAIELIEYRILSRMN